MPAYRDQFLSRRTAAVLILIGGAAFCAFFALIVVIDPADRTVTGPSSYSRSAVGHAALAGLLREAGYDVRINRSRRGRGVAPEDVLLILEPNLRRHTVADLQRLMEGKRRVLVALPKWRPSPESSPRLRRGWIVDATLLSKSQPGMVARAVLVPAAVARPEADMPWTDGLGRGRPAIDESPQLIADAALDPLISRADGILVGEVTDSGDARIVVLADPDILANHGLYRDHNAGLALGLIERLAPTPNATVHFDETLHGLAIVPSLPRHLTAPPFLAATLLALGAVAMTLWRAAVSFGTPRPSGDGGPVFGSGHETLLRNAGRLLAAGDHAAYIADRYGKSSLEEAARRLHLGQGGDRDGDLRGMLERVAARRGIRARLPDSANQRPLAKARRYYDWMEEMFHGSGSNRDAR